MKNIVVGTKGWIKFPVFKGSRFNPVFDRNVTIYGECVREMYGSGNKHWFTFLILDSDDSEYPVGTKKRFQGKNVYRYIDIEEQPEDIDLKTKDKTLRKSYFESMAQESIAEVDSLYLEAIEKNDVNTINRMLEDKAYSSGYTIKVYHTTQQGSGLSFSNTFKTSGLSAHFGDESAAKDRGKHLSDFDKVVGSKERINRRYETLPFLLKIENPLNMPDLASLDSNTGNPIEEEREKFDSLPEDEKKYRMDFSGEVPYVRSWENDEDFSLTIREMEIIDSETFLEVQYSKEKAVNVLKEEGYDGIVYENAVENPGSDSYIIFDPNQVKSFSVTRDDNGEAILLSRRFDSNVDDYRY